MVKNMVKNVQPNISVILPAYNAERFLKEAIDSILAQTYTNFELIVLNDGSTDRTEEIILSYNDPRIRYVKNETNLKLIKTLNKGIDLAKGKYIARMDADDISLPTRLEKEVKYMEEHPECGVVSVLPYVMAEDGKILHKSRFFISTHHISCLYVNLFATPILHPGSFFQAEILKKYKYVDSPKVLHVEAYDLWCRMFKDNVKFGVVNEHLLNYRLNSTSVCHTESQFDKHLALAVKFQADILGIEPNYSAMLSLGDVQANNDFAEIYSSVEYLHSTYKLFRSKFVVDALSEKEIKRWIGKRELEFLMFLAKTKRYFDFLKILMKSNYIFTYFFK